MSKSFYSKALEANLSKTLQKEVALHEDHLWLLQLSKNSWGIQERTRNFFNEYHHTYANYGVVSNELRRLSLGDFWFYDQNPDREKAHGIILSFFRDTLEKTSKLDDFENIYTTLIEYIALMLRHQTPDLKLISEGLDILKLWIGKDHPATLRTSSFFKNQLEILCSFQALKDDFFDLLHALMIKVIRFWAETSNAENWYEGNREYFSADFHNTLKSIGQPYFAKLLRNVEKTKTLEDLNRNIPLYAEITEYFISLIDTCPVITDRFYYIVYLLHIQGMAQARNTLLLKLNSLIKTIFAEIKASQVKPFIKNLFELFGEMQQDHSYTVLDCIATFGKEIIQSKHAKHTKDFVEKMIELPFVVPGPLKLSSEWRTRVDTNHIKNIRIWLELFEASPDHYNGLITALIVNLKLKGIFIFDTDLFQKDVSALLNSDFHPYFRQVKQLCRIFPVYFNEIGAEGELRDITTEIDELTSRQDRLIYFLRKQVHIESNNTHIGLTRKIFDFWTTGDLQPLLPLLPEDIAATIDPIGKWVTPMKDLIRKVSEKAKVSSALLIEQHPDRIDKWVQSISDHTEVNKKRLVMLCRLYNILIEKYSFSAADIVKCISKYHHIPASKVRELEAALQKKNNEEALKLIYSFIGELNSIILSPGKTEGWENIYHKRHVAFGIPSMYGEYHERRFEALGLIFKLEQAARQITHELDKSINLNYITAKTLERIASILQLYKEGLLLDGIDNHVFNSNLDMFYYSLRSQSFSLHQYINIFSFMGGNIREIIKKYFFIPYEENLGIILKQTTGAKTKRDNDPEQYIHGRSEAFYRDMLASSFLLQSLDNFITMVLTTLRNMVDNYSIQNLRDIMTYNPDMVISPLYEPTPFLDNQVYLGSKAYFLKKLYFLKYPIPQGFVITTEVFRRKETILQHKILNRDIDSMIIMQIRKLEKLTGKELGNPKHPLLLSVRSGTAVSMPGAMNTFLNVGINEKIIESLSLQPNYGWTSWDCYRRFLQSWGMASGISRDTFDQIMIDFKLRYGIEQKVQFTSQQMRKMSFVYREVLKQHDIHIEEEVFPQVRQAILKVFDSWNTERAQFYRKHLQIADDWGTAVIVQKMVLGNINYTSGTGVVFTHHPKMRKPGVHLYGDYSLVSQGEDVVGGLVHVQPVSINQKQTGSKGLSLEEKFPLIYRRLYNIACELTERHGFGHQEIEFTFESEKAEDLFILQIRDMDVRQEDKIRDFAVSRDKMKLLGRGIGIGGGVMNGILIFDQEDLSNMRSRFPDKQLILVRPDTVPDDIGLIFHSDGLLTARGGATSHAAVTAARLGKICIVNCVDLIVNEKEKKCTIKKQSLSVGDEIAIDGNIGSIYKGYYPLADRYVHRDEK